MGILLFTILFYPAPTFSHPPQVLERGVPGGPPAQSSARVQQHLCLGLEPVQEPHLSLQVTLILIVIAMMAMMSKEHDAILMLT